MDALSYSISEASWPKVNQKGIRIYKEYFTCKNLSSDICNRLISLLQTCLNYH